jgi:transcriptional regulator with XRE-family HTH domain
MSIGTNLRVLRGKTKLTQDDVAKKLGVDRRTYINWENNTNDVRDEYIPELAKIFNVEISELFRKKETGIVINQQNTDNNDTSVNNSIVLVLPDRESVDKLVEVFKNSLERK